MPQNTMACTLYRPFTIVIGVYIGVGYGRLDDSKVFPGSTVKNYFYGSLNRNQT